MPFYTSKMLSDGTAAGLRPRPYEATASSADRKEPERPDRPGAQPVRGPAVVGRPAAENRTRPRNRPRLLALRL